MKIIRFGFFKLYENQIKYFVLNKKFFNLINSKVKCTNKHNELYPTTSTRLSSAPYITGQTKIYLLQYLLLLYFLMF